MYSILEGLLYIVGGFFLLYLLLYAAYLFASVLVGAYKLYRRDKMTLIRNELKHEYYYPISVLVPAYNEEVNIVDNIRSLLQLDYRQYEIIVVDDGSTDDTARVLIEGFGLRRTGRPIRKRVPCQPEVAVYEGRINRVDLTLITKVNGRKGDALNMGINASRYPWFICLDADSFLQRDSLEKIMQPVLEDSSIVAVGGMIHASQGAKMENGMVVDYCVPRNPVVAMQVMEYERSFLASRILMDGFNGNLIISGAFGLFKKDVVVAAGGYDTQTLGEDMELVVKLHVFCRNNNIPYSIRYEPTAVCWSQVPSSLRDLGKQRRRWHLGLFQCLHKYRQIFLNHKFGFVSFISYLYYLLYELLSPYVELLGVGFTVLFYVTGFLNLSYAIWFLLLYGIYGACLTMTAFFQRVYTQKMKLRFSDVIGAICACLVEVLALHFFENYIRATAFIGYRKRKHQWGSIQRLQHEAHGQAEADAERQASPVAM